MLMKIFKRKFMLPLAFLLVIGISILFPSCDTGNNSGMGFPEIPDVPAESLFDPVEPETPWVEGQVTIDIYSFNDFHGSVDSSASASNPGAARFTAIVKHLISQSEHVMLLAAGDNYQGSALSNYFHGEPVSKMMKELGVKYSVIGNHEWDWGTGKFAQFAQDGNITFLTANIFLKGTDNRPDFCHPYVIANRAGRRIGIIGLTTTLTPDLVSASLIEKYDFRGPGDWLKNMVNDLRTAQKCDAVIAFTHMGSSGSGTNVNGEAAGLANPDMGFDAIISAHTHNTVSGTVNGIPVIQASYNGRAVGKLSFNFDGHNLLSVTPNIISNFTGSSILPTGTIDAGIADMIAGYEAQVAPIMNEVIGKFGSAQSIGKDAWANKLVFDYIARKASEPGWRAGAGWQDFVLIQNSGGWRSVTLGGPNDNVTVGFMWTLMPFDNEIYLFELRGDYLMNLLKRLPVSGSGSLGSSPVITNASGSGNTWTITSSGEQINPSKLYKVSMNDFMFTGGDNYGVEGYAVYNPATLVLGVPLRDGMIEQMRWRTQHGETPIISETVGTLTGGPLVHEYVIKAANTRYVEDTALIHLINDAMLYYTQTYNVTLSGTAPLSPAANAFAGTLTRASMSGIYNYDNTLSVVEMTGSQFKEWMEWAHWDYHQTKMKPGDLTIPYGGGGTGYNFDQFKGLTYKVDLSKDRGQRIVSMKNQNGTNFDLAKTYRVAINNYRQGQLTSTVGVTGSVATIANNVDSTLTVNGVTITNYDGMKGVLADYIERAKGGAITNQFIPSWEFIIPAEDEAWYPAYRAKAVELLNKGTLTFSATRPITVTDVKPFMPAGSIDPPDGYFPEPEQPKKGPLSVDFEDAAWDAGNYSERTVNSGGFEWTVSGVGTMDSNDRYKGTKSIRLRGNSGDNCRVELMDYLTTGIRTVSFDYASYSSHSGGAIVLYYQIKGSTNWVKSGEVTAPAWESAMLTVSSNINTTSSVRIKIVREGGLANYTSVNIDNIVVTCAE
ncbi:MAG: 5'-nucleotidase C-terminal domain-containing protein [Treponema sp.]|nr:5'-nucleotidase C-terminal domain-containing protein [Treponema sp.]